MRHFERLSPRRGGPGRVGASRAVVSRGPGRGWGLEVDGDAGAVVGHDYVAVEGSCDLGFEELLRPISWESLLRHIALRPFPVADGNRRRRRNLCPTGNSRRACCAARRPRLRWRVAILAVGAARPSPIILVSAVAALLALTWLRLSALFLARGGRLRVLEQGAIELE